LHGWKKAGELERMCCTLEEEVDISQQDSESLERSVMNEASSEALRIHSIAKYRSLSVKRRRCKTMWILLTYAISSTRKMQSSTKCDCARRSKVGMMQNVCCAMGFRKLENRWITSQLVTLCGSRWLRKLSSWQTRRH